MPTIQQSPSSPTPLTHSATMHQQSPRTATARLCSSPPALLHPGLLSLSRHQCRARLTRPLLSTRAAAFLLPGLRARLQQTESGEKGPAETYISSRKSSTNNVGAPSALRGGIPLARDANPLSLCSALSFFLPPPLSLSPLSTPGMSDTGAVRVAVRVRPMNDRYGEREREKEREKERRSEPQQDLGCRVSPPLRLRCARSALWGKRNVLRGTHRLSHTKAHTHTHTKAHTHTQKASSLLVPFFLLSCALSSLFSLSLSFRAHFLSLPLPLSFTEATPATSVPPGSARQAQPRPLFLVASPAPASSFACAPSLPPFSLLIQSVHPARTHTYTHTHTHTDFTSHTHSLISHPFLPSSLFPSFLLSLSPLLSTSPPSITGKRSVCRCAALLADGMRRERREAERGRSALLLPSQRLF